MHIILLCELLVIIYVAIFLVSISEEPPARGEIVHVIVPFANCAPFLLNPDTLPIDPFLSVYFFITAIQSEMRLFIHIQLVL